MLCEEFDCVPAAGAAACVANENTLSLLSSAMLAGAVGALRLITCELTIP